MQSRIAAKNPGNIQPAITDEMSGTVPIWTQFAGIVSPFF